jgi:hypothetical protein
VNTNVWFCQLAPPETYIPLLGGAISAGAIIIAATATNSCALSNNRRLWVATAAFCACFQVGHFFEHGTQVAGFTHTTTDVTLTWWAQQIAYGFAWLLNRSPHVGVEAMHFFGDWIYTAGWIAWRRLHPREIVGKIGSRFQYAHQAEHCLLFPTAYFLGQPWGVTTLAAHGPAWLRITIHFFLNLFGSILWAVSAVRVARASRGAVWRRPTWKEMSGRGGRWTPPHAHPAGPRRERR